VSRVCVFCGSNFGASPAYADAARALASALVAGGHSLVYGGGDVGLMREVADAVLAGGGEVVGVMPRHLVDREIAHRRLTRLEITDSMHSRKARMAELADGFVALPGGFGTFEEIVEVLTWNQLGLLAAPVVFLDVQGFFEPLLAMFDQAVAAGFVRAEHRALASATSDPWEAVRLATAPATVPVVHKWADLDPT
jgi:uncharacterized protein (TIGR00730 family)